MDSRTTTVVVVVVEVDLAVAVFVITLLVFVSLKLITSWPQSSLCGRKTGSTFQGKKKKKLESVSRKKRILETASRP